ncbi:hypothetical protein [Halorubrum vacuolatum]|uniref:Phospholipase_D-nuclease N-terminal n=1 Tax=Halorubrum vacuolatum TaxID=63740 RepID=A0A238UQA1_HALVU|nr:hypothetical protein [Halorubrum vacuolatum]SNR24312.1 hypothetical protein SAMN06264855_101249 [Halorubrum vacuolatum]
MNPVPVEIGVIWSLPVTVAVYGILLLVAIWIYRDAKARGSKWPIAWFLATLVFTIIPVLIYLYLHREDGPAGGSDGV